MRSKGSGWAAVAVALTILLVLPASASADPTLPPVGAPELIASVRSARPGPLAGTVRLNERLGLTGLPRSATGERIVRLWSDGAGRRRLSMSEAHRERTVVDDGVNSWSWDSATRSVTRAPSTPPHPAEPMEPGRIEAGLAGNPMDAASSMLAMLAPSSTMRVDPTATVAGRAAYQLVLDPLPTERTVLHQIRVAVDGRTRMPLDVSVLANGSAEPALRIGFGALRFGPQDPALFRFTPAPGVSVRDAPGYAAGRPAPASPGADPARPGGPAGTAGPTLYGQGWDTVLVRSIATGASTPARPGARRRGSRPDPSRLGTPIQGRWGSGRLLSTPAGSAVLTSDGRIAIGAVPVQVLTEALDR